MEILAEKGSGAYPLAGGTDLLPCMKRREITPSVLVNLKRIRGMDKIENEAENGVRIGALAKISMIEYSALVHSKYPALARSAALLGSPSIRNLATLGGNIARASPASDMAPSLMVLGTRAAIEGPHGKREIGVNQVFSGPKRNTLSSGELITSFFIPEIKSQTGSTYLKLGRVAGMDCALVGIAALLTLSGKPDEAKEARVALAAVGPVPIRARKTEEYLLSGPLTDERVRKAARIAVEESSPISDFRATSSYRKEMVRVFAHRAFSEALGQARGEK
jgi:carbon-monoxide dehydrogenase medium subunit